MGYLSIRKKYNWKWPGDEVRGEYAVAQCSAWELDAHDIVMQVKGIKLNPKGNLKKLLANKGYENFQ